MTSKSINDNKFNIFNYIFPAVVLIIVCIFCNKYMGWGEFSVVLSWWSMLFLLGLVFMPISLILFKRFHDNGWIFSKTIGIAVSAWLLWYLSSMKLLRFTRMNSIIVIVICACFNACIFLLYNKISKDPVIIKDCFSFKKINSMVNAEVIFFSFLAIWCYIKGFNPAAYSTEKFMDYGYITSILKSEYMPAHDMWLSGNDINYYYVGQYISAFLVRVSGVGAGFGYNLMMMTLAAFGFSLPYSIGYNLMSRVRCENPGHKNTIAGMLSGISLSLAGNMHFPIFKWIMPKVQRILGKPVDNYWFANATRYIGYNPDVEDKTIHEFPSYSFVLGDLHAHVINILFVLTVVAILFAWLLNRKALADITKKQGIPDKIDYVREIFNPHMILCMFFIGLFHMTNYWDFPIYFCVCGSIVLYSNLVTYRYSKHSWILTGLQAVAYVVVWTLVALPFTLAFDSISSSIKLCTKHTIWYQYLVLWGLPLMVCGVFIVTRHIRAHKINVKNSIENKTKKQNWIAALLDSMTESDAFIFVLSFCAIGLILIPEVVYVVDIYGGAYQRANTMFKLVYQAFMLFAICMPYIIMKFLKVKVSARVKNFARVSLVLLCCTFCYFFEALDAWFASYYTTIDASAFVKNEDPADAMAIEWINNNASDDEVVLEMCGLSYTFFNRISVFTGNSTVLGWQTHEWLWRSSGNKEYPRIVSERYEDVKKIYTTNDIKELAGLIEKYNISYIYVGQGERYDGYFSTQENGTNSGYYHGGFYVKLSVNDTMIKSVGDVTEFKPEKAIGSYIVKINKEKISNILDKQEKYSNSISHPNTISFVDKDDNILVESYVYDDNKNVVSKTCYNEKTVTSTTEYFYDGNVIKEAREYDSRFELVGTYSYDGADAYGRYSKKNFYSSETGKLLSTTVNFYDGYLLKSQTYSDGEGNSSTTTYQYDENYILTNKIVAKGDVVEEYIYNNDGEKIIDGTLNINGNYAMHIAYTY